MATKAQPNVIVYAQDGCGSCHAEMEFLSQNGVAFEERNIRKNEQYLKELKELGSSATPTTVIGEETVIGFDKDRLQALLDL